MGRHHHLGADLGAAATVDFGRIYAAMDWLGGSLQDAIEAQLARRHLAPAANPSRMALFDLVIFPGWRDVTARWLLAGTPGTARKETADRVRAALHRP